jgi:hypothetical protein
MTSRISTRASLQSRAVAHGTPTSRSLARRTPTQLAVRRRIETLIGLAAPVLDLVLFAGEQVSRVAGRNQVDPDPPRRLGDRAQRTPLGGPPDGAVSDIASVDTVADGRHGAV